MLRVYEVGNMEEPIDYVVAEDESDAIDNIEHQGNAENLLSADISEIYDSKEDIKYIILNELNEDAETVKQLLINYGFDVEEEKIKKELEERFAFEKERDERVRGLKKDSSTDPQKIIKEFKEFVEVVYDNPATFFHKNNNKLHFIFYVPGDYKKEDFDEDMNEFCQRFEGLNYELINQTPNSPSPQYFSKNTKLMYPLVKDFETLSKQEDKLKTAINLFKDQWNSEPDLDNEDDQEDLVLLYNEYMEELREWKPVQLYLVLPEIDEEITDSNDEEEKAKKEILKKYPEAYVPEIDEKTGLPILPDDQFGDWEY